MADTKALTSRDNKSIYDWGGNSPSYKQLGTCKQNSERNDFRHNEKKNFINDVIFYACYESTYGICCRGRKLHRDC